MKCPRCDDDVILAAVHNQRNGKWTAVPLDHAPGNELGNFEVTDETHEAFGILGNSLGELSVGVYKGDHSPEHEYVPHPPDHFLEPVGHAHE